MFSQRPSATWRGTFATILRSMEERVGLINDCVARNDGEKERKRREERGEERRGEKWTRRQKRVKLDERSRVEADGTLAACGHCHVLRNGIRDSRLLSRDIKARSRVLDIFLKEANAYCQILLWVGIHNGKNWEKIYRCRTENRVQWAITCPVKGEGRLQR